jgi:hypothetical protein
MQVYIHPPDIFKVSLNFVDDEDVLSQMSND